MFHFSFCGGSKYVSISSTAFNRFDKNQYWILCSMLDWFCHYLPIPQFWRLLLFTVFYSVIKITQKVSNYEWDFFGDFWFVARSNLENKEDHFLARSN